MWQLTWQDYAVFLTFILVSISIGIYHGCSGGKQKTTREFLLSNRNLSVIPTMISLMVSFQSAIMFLGFVAETSANGFSIWPGYCFSVGLCMLLTERFIVPVLHPLKLTSLFEYLDMRYNSKVLRKLASVFSILSALIYMSLSSYAPCLALEYLSGISLNVTVPLMMFICVCYTAFGGMRAVIWTDVFQCMVMFTAIIVIVIKGTYNSGGISHIVSTMYENNRIQMISFSVDPEERHTFWSFMIGYCMFWMSSFGISQASVQRYCSVPTLKQARLVLLLTIPTVFCIASLVCFSGFIIFTHFVDTQCDPVGSKYVKTYNLLLPVYMKQVFGEYKGFIGVFMAMIYGGSLSSISSSLSGVSANTWEDHLKPCLPRISEFNATLITKAVVIVYGVIAILMAFILDQLPGTIIKVATQLMGAIVSPLFGVFIMALCFRKSEYIGAIVGSICGFIIVLFTTIGSLGVRSFSTPLPTTSVSGCPVNQTVNTYIQTALPVASGFSKLFTISYLWYLPLGAFVTIIIGMTISLIIKWRNDDNSVVPDELLINFRRGFSWSDEKYDTTLKDTKNLNNLKRIEIIDKEKESKTSRL